MQNLRLGDGLGRRWIDFKCEFLERAAKNISNCPLCNKPYNPEDLIVLNQISKEKIQKMRDAMEDKRTRKHDQKMSEKRDKRLNEKLQLETEKISAEDKISEWMKSADRRRSSTRHVIKKMIE